MAMTVVNLGAVVTFVKHLVRKADRITLISYTCLHFWKSVCLK